MSTRRLLPALLVLLAGAASAPANAVVYCKTFGVPKGCVQRPPVVVTPAPVVVTPAPVVVAPAPVVVAPVVTPRVAPYSAVNRGGPVNRVGRR